MIFVDRHKSRQGNLLVHQDLRLDGGSRLPPVVEEKSAAYRLKQGDKRVSSGRERDEEGTPRTF